MKKYLPITIAFVLIILGIIVYVRSSKNQEIPQSPTEAQPTFTVNQALDANKKFNDHGDISTPTPCKDEGGNIILHCKG